MHEDWREEVEQEDEATRRAVYGNGAARQIVDALANRWNEFTILSPEEYLGEVYDETLGVVDSRLSDGTPVEDVPRIAEEFFTNSIAPLEKRLGG